MRKAEIVLCLFLGAALAAQPGLYRWKDKKGKEWVTNTPPPPGAVPMEVPPPQNQKEADAGPGAAPQEQPQKAPVSASWPGLSAAQQERWRALDQSLADARARKDTAAIEAVVEGLFRESLWGNGLWTVPLLPLATFALAALLGWWAAGGLRQPLASALIAVGLLGGLALAQFTLSRFLYRNQFLRLQTNLSLLEFHLGGKVPRPANHQALEHHFEALAAASRPLAPPWAFLLEARAAEDTMVRVALEP
jgi:hypothetical protein